MVRHPVAAARGAENAAGRATGSAWSVRSRQFAGLVVLKDLQDNLERNLPVSLPIRAVLAPEIGESDSSTRPSGWWKKSSVLAGTLNGPFRRWLNAFDGEARIAWYPSAGEDFRDLLYLSSRFSDHSPVTGPEPRHPDIFLHTDYFPWRESTFLDSRVIYDGARSRLEVQDIEELPRCDVPLDPEIVDFPDGSKATGRVVFMNVSVSSTELGRFSAPVVYAFVLCPLLISALGVGVTFPQAGKIGDCDLTVREFRNDL